MEEKQVNIPVPREENASPVEQAPAPDSAAAKPQSQKPKKRWPFFAILAAVLVVALIALAAFLSGNSPSAVAERYCKALYGDTKAFANLTAYDWQAYVTRTYGGDDEAYFKATSEFFDGDIASWNDYYRKSDIYSKNILEDLFGKAYTLTVEVKKISNLSVKQLLTDQESFLDELEACGSFDRDAISDAKQAVVETTVDGSTKTETATYLLFLVKTGGSWKVLTYEYDSTT